MTVDNIVKMWHSIEQVWNLMEQHAQQAHITYDRVAMLRSDVVYMTPIDIWDTGTWGTVDQHNQVAVIPGGWWQRNAFFKTYDCVWTN